MFKIDRKKALTFITGFALVSSLSLVGCESESNKYNDELSEDTPQYNDEQGEINKIYVSSEVANCVAVYLDDSSALIIPVSKYTTHNTGFSLLYVDNKNNYEKFANSNLTIFGNEDNMSAYEKALNFSRVMRDEVYLYGDVIEGHPINLVESEINEEMGTSKEL